MSKNTKHPVVTFQYIKNKDDPTDRAGFKFTAPSNVYQILEMTEDVDTDEVIAKLDAAHDKYLEEVYAINKQYGLLFKTFKREKMKDYNEFTD